jgi:hypothetical protein
LGFGLIVKTKIVKAKSVRNTDDALYHENKNMQIYFNNFFQHLHLFRSGQPQGIAPTPYLMGM